MNLVGISNSKPTGIERIKTIRSYPNLYPGWKFLHEYKNGIITPEEYEARYRYHILDKLNPAWVYGDLGDDAILLCWEKPGRFCHRRIVARWFYENLKIKVNEL